MCQSNGSSHILSDIKIKGKNSTLPRTIDEVVEIKCCMYFLGKYNTLHNTVFYC